MADEKPAQTVELVWSKNLLFEGRAGAIELKLDSAGVEGPSPMQALAFALAGCMAMDVVHVLRKGRQDMQGLRATLHAWRAPEAPRRFVEVQLRFTVTGAVETKQLERAIALSRDRYCSVWHSMRPDILFETSYEVLPKS